MYNCLVQSQCNLFSLFQRLEDKSEDEESQREDVLNQVLFLLNTTLMSQQQQQAAVVATEQEAAKLPLSYLHGSLGLVPSE